MKILMTGCGSSMGAYIREQLISQGHRIFGIGSDGPDLKFDLEELALISNDESVKYLFDEAEQSLEGLPDCVINNAAITRIDWTTQHSTEDFIEVLCVNLIAPFAICKEFVRRIQALQLFPSPESGMPSGEKMFEDQEKIYRIINTSTMGAKVALRGSHGYCASKAGLEMMTKVIAKETAGILPLMAVCIRPNGIEGAGMTEYTLEQVMRTRGWTREKAEAYNRNTPLGRCMTFEEIWQPYNYFVNIATLFASGTIYDCPGGTGL